MTDLAFDSSGNLYGISSSGGANLYSINIGTGQYGDNLIAPGGSTHLVTIDPTTGNVTDIGSSVIHLDAIAFTSAPEPGAMALFSAGALALLAVRRKSIRAA